MADFLGNSGNYTWAAVSLGLMGILVPRMIALIALALVMRGSGPAERPQLLVEYSKCLPYWVLAPAWHRPALGHNRPSEQ
jgi:hypothetical protein